MTNWQERNHVSPLQASYGYQVGILNKNGPHHKGTISRVPSPYRDVVLPVKDSHYKDKAILSL